MNFVEELSWRGLIQDSSDPELANKIVKGDSFYVGFDPTAPSLQIGNLVPIAVAMHLARAGLKPIFLFGGATGFIGDPSGKSSERKLLDRETIDQNVRLHSKKVTEIATRSGVSAEFVNNYDWTKDITIIDFLREVGKHFTVNYMLAKEVVSSRLNGDGISFTEFSYMLLQGNDFLHLFQTKNCKLQIGGSDQWGNVTAGLELIRKKIQSQAFALSFPLLTDSHGKKFGKSEAGTLWLDGTMTSPYRMHQFWLNVEDADVLRYLKIFTFLTQEEIAILGENLTKAPEKREAQRALADAVCTLIHGEEATADAKRSAEVLFGGSLNGLSEATLLEIFKDVPSSTLDRSKLGSLAYVDLLVESGLLKSKGEAKRLIQSGGAYLNNERVSDAGLIMQEKSAINESLYLLRTGKKNYHLVKLAVK